MLDFDHEYYLDKNLDHHPNRRSKKKRLFKYTNKINSITGSVINASVYCFALIRKIPRIVFFAAISRKTCSSVKYSSHAYK